MTGMTLALAGNPNAGKTTLFNELTGARQHVGNWPGKTVEKKDGVFHCRGLTCYVVDLPGAYSLNAYSPEEVIARDYIIHQQPDLVINVVDASNLERNLYLTTQLLELGAPLVIALNVVDIARARGLRIDRDRLSALLGRVPVVETIANKGQGIDKLLETLVNKPTDFKINYGKELETEIENLTALIQQQAGLAQTFEPRWLALKLLEGEADLAAQVERLAGGSSLLAQARQAGERIGQIYGDSADIALADARYGFIHGLVRQVVDKSQANRYTLTDRIDRIVTNRVLGLPLFLLVMYVMFKLVVDVSAPYLDWVDGVIGGPVSRWIERLLALLLAPAWLQSLALDGVVAGVGGVLVFLPGLFVLYFFLTLLEDSGYLARVAFVMDRLMSFTGLHGKSFIPLILGFGCAVPAIYATRTLENERDRIATGLLVPLMSCSARLPVYVVFGLAFFPQQAGLLITGLYLTGIVLAALAGWLFSKTILKNSPDNMFALELPPYRLPTLKGLLIHTWEKSKEFVYKAGTVILSVSIVLWFLLNLPWGVANPRDSLFGQLSAAASPIFAPAGFDKWEATGALVTGFIAKEVVVSAMSQIYIGQAEPPAAPPTTLGQDIAEIIIGFGQATVDAGKTLFSLIPGVNLVETEPAEADTALGAALTANFTPLAALAFLLFVLVYTPCVATLGAIKAEYGWKWMGVSASYQFGLAWLLAALVYQAGRFLGWG
jgi:ferrous iron transport protein B